MSLLDFLFPTYCVNCRKVGKYVCADCFSYISFTEQSVCVMCHRPALAGFTHPACQTRYSLDGVFASVSYQGIVKKLISSFKYKPFVKDLHPFLGDLLYEGMIQKEQVARLFSEESVLMPIPLHPKRLRWRGYNQSAVLTRDLGKRLSLPISEGLIRIKDTHQQVGLSQANRKENMKGAFALNKRVAQIVPQVLLVDDVVTSGTTLREAAGVLKRAGIKRVWGITLAHGE